eukprot:1886473-Pyramimonas_sp.AAC.1
MNAAWRAFAKYKSVLCSKKYPLASRLKLFRLCRRAVSFIRVLHLGTESCRHTDSPGHVAKNDAQDLPSTQERFRVMGAVHATIYKI